MASIAHDKKTGRRMLQFTDPNGKRHTLRLGKVTKKQAEHVRLRIDQLLGAKLTGSPIDPDTARWVGGLDQTFQKRLGATGLIHVTASIGLKDFINSYIKSRRDVKDSTKVMYDQTRRRLLGYFDPQTPIRQIDQPQAIAWRQYLAQTGLADNTVRRTTGIAKQFFAAAIRDGYVEANPFQGLPCTVRPNSKRSYFITTEEAEKVLAACPDDEWKLIFTLCRYGGLRCPSEILQLTWDDIDWQSQRFTVRSPKTEHHDGHDMRIVPLFPEVAQALHRVQNQSRPDSKDVITRYRLSNVNLRTQLNRIIRKAGMEPWPKLFQNLRSSCETELAERFPLHVVTAWLGNSVSVAQKHYLQVTEAHILEAAKRQR
ncbi:MAG: tyrosine-type recombinase/integrase [Planctomycetota bacterium]